jgi:MFS family permease
LLASSSNFISLLRSNRNYRLVWTEQVVSEVGDHFNSIAVFSLALANTGSGMAVAGVLLARGAAVMLAGPVAGVLLDRMDRRRIMILSDVIRPLLALSFIIAIPAGRSWLLFPLSAAVGLANWRGKLPEPVPAGIEPEEIEVHGDPVV